MLNYGVDAEFYFLGSTSTNFSSAGCFLYNKEVMMAFNPTDLP